MNSPLAERMRPHCLSDFVGQSHLVGDRGVLSSCIAQGRIHSMILWGPPGIGKTTLAEILGHAVQAHVEKISAVLAGVKDIRAVISRAQQLHSEGRMTVLFVDEVHRFNKSQQDAFLPFVESGLITLIGATTENPSFQLNNALLSRTKVYTLQALSAEDLRTLISRALQQAYQETLDNVMDDSALSALVQAADGDARSCLNLLESIMDHRSGHMTQQVLIDGAMMKPLLGRLYRRFDQSGEEFYNQVSALHKSVRGSDPDAALYWLARLLDGGCDTAYVLRRIVRMASEDIGNADPRALQIAIDCAQSYERLGSPEGDLALAQAVVYCACAAKSNAVYTAFKQAQNDVERYGSQPVPNHLRNAPTKLMRSLGYAKGYRYSHDEPDGFSAGVCYFPQGVDATEYYQPVERGLEIKIGEKLKCLRKKNKEPC
jgi:putative ATPase